MGSAKQGLSHWTFPGSRRNEWLTSTWQVRPVALSRKDLASGNWSLWCAWRLFSTQQQDHEWRAKCFLRSILACVIAINSVTPTQKRRRALWRAVGEQKDNFGNLPGISLASHPRATVLSFEVKRRPMFPFSNRKEKRWNGSSSLKSLRKEASLRAEVEKEAQFHEMDMTRIEDWFSSFSFVLLMSK